MGVLLQIRCIFSEHLLLRTPLDFYFRLSEVFLYYIIQILITFQYWLHGKLAIVRTVYLNSFAFLTSKLT